MVKLIHFGLSSPSNQASFLVLGQFSIEYEATGFALRFRVCWIPTFKKLSSERVQRGRRGTENE